MGNGYSLLGYTDYFKLFRVYTNGSCEGHWTVLVQEKNRVEWLIAYERNPHNYSSFKLKLQALVWAQKSLRSISLKEMWTSLLTTICQPILTLLSWKPWNSSGLQSQPNSMIPSIISWVACTVMWVRYLATPWKSCKDAWSSAWRNLQLLLLK